MKSISATVLASFSVVIALFWAQIAVAQVPSREGLRSTVLDQNKLLKNPTTIDPINTGPPTVRLPIRVVEWGPREGASRGAKLVFEVLTSSIFGDKVEIFLGQIKLEITSAEEIGQSTRFDVRVPYLSVQSGQRYPLTLKTSSTNTVNKRTSKLTGLDSTTKLINRPPLQSLVFSDSFLIEDSLWERNQSVFSNIRRVGQQLDTLPQTDRLILPRYADVLLEFDFKYVPVEVLSNRFHAAFNYAIVEFLHSNGPQPESVPRISRYGAQSLDHSQFCFFGSEIPYLRSDTGHYPLTIESINESAGTVTMRGRFRLEISRCIMENQFAGATIFTDLERQIVRNAGTSSNAETHERFLGKVLPVMLEKTIEITSFPERGLGGTVRTDGVSNIPIRVNQTSDLFGSLQTLRNKLQENVVSGCDGLSFSTIGGDLSVGITSSAFAKNCSVALGKNIEGVSSVTYRLSDQSSPDSGCGPDPVDDRNVIVQLIDMFSVVSFNFDRVLPKHRRISHMKRSRIHPNLDPEGKLTLDFGCHRDLSRDSEFSRRIDSATFSVKENLRLNGQAPSSTNINLIFKEDTQICFAGEDC